MLLELLRVWLGMPRLFLTFAGVYLGVSAFFFAHYWVQVFRYNYLGNYPYEGTDPFQFYYAKWYLRIIMYIDTLSGWVFVVLAILSGVIYIVSA